MAVKRELPLALLQWQLGDMGQRDGLSAPSVLMLSQAPILLSARGEISDLRRQAAEEPEDERPAPVTQPVREESQPAPVTAGADNGVTAKTLIPTDPSGYTVCGKVYIRNTTQYTLSNEELLKPFAAELTGEAPQILILHTHSTEAYAQDSAAPYQESGTARTTDPSYNIIKVGEEITRIFEEMGLSVIHDTNLYDYPDYNGAYERSKAAAAQYLAQYPTLQMVLDVHRDAIETENGSRMAPVCTVNGRQTAQVMIICGCDNGTTVSLPNYRLNLRFAAAWETAMEGLYPGFTRPVLFSYRFYNQDLTPGSLLIEIGGHGNNLNEALYAGQLAAKGLAAALLGGA